MKSMKIIKRCAQSLIEYGLVLALVAVISITVLSKFGKSITNTGSQASSTLNGVSDAAANDYCKDIGKSKYVNGECQ